MSPCAVCVYMCVCMCVCMCACARACVCACVCVSVYAVYMSLWVCVGRGDVVRMNIYIFNEMTCFNMCVELNLTNYLMAELV